MKLLDVCGYIGKWPYWDLWYGEEMTAPSEVSLALGLMDKNGIGVCAVSSTRAILLDWEQGNEEMFTAVRMHPDRFLPVPVIAPDRGKDMAAKIAKYAQAGAKGFRLVPFFQGHQLSEAQPVKKMLNLIAATRLPILLPMRLFMNWGLPVEPVAGLDYLASACPESTIVVEGVNYGEIARILPLLRRRDNVALDTSCLAIKDGLNEVLAQVGVERVYFGSALCLQNPAPLVAQLRSSSDAGQLAAIGWENGCRLFGLANQSTPAAHHVR